MMTVPGVINVSRPLASSLPLNSSKTYLEPDLLKATFVSGRI